MDPFNLSFSFLWSIFCFFLCLSKSMAVFSPTKRFSNELFSEVQGLSRKYFSHSKPKSSQMLSTWMKGLGVLQFEPPRFETECFLVRIWTFFLLCDIQFTIKQVVLYCIAWSDIISNSLIDYPRKILFSGRILCINLVNETIYRTWGKLNTIHKTQWFNQ